MEIAVKNLQSTVRLKTLPIVQIIKRILRQEGVAQASLSFVFVTNQKIKALNKKYLGRNYATDVLSFDLRERPKAMSAEIVISVDAAKHNCKVFKTTLGEEIVLYIIHGLLHLLGYDDGTKKDIAKMRKKE